MTRRIIKQVPQVAVDCVRWVQSRYFVEPVRMRGQALYRRGKISGFRRGLVAAVVSKGVDVIRVELGRSASGDGGPRLGRSTWPAIIRGVFQEQGPSALRSPRLERAHGGGCFVPVINRDGGDSGNKHGGPGHGAGGRAEDGVCRTAAALSGEIVRFGEEDVVTVTR